MSRQIRSVAFVVCAALALSTTLQGQGRGGRGGPPGGGQGPGGPGGPGAQAAALFDATGYWVSLVTEDWRYRMITPGKGDYGGVPMTPAARTLADAWDPAADDAAGNQCKSYGAAAIMRVPGRLHVTWKDGNTLQMDTDAGTQTRLFPFVATPDSAAPRSWQGTSVASWDTGGGGGRGGRGGRGGPGGRGGGADAPAAAGADAPARGAGAGTSAVGAGADAPRGGGPGGGRGGPGGGAAAGGPRFGSLKVVTTGLKAGYLRKNGVPYSEDTTVTEYYELSTLPNSAPMLFVTVIVQDPKYLQQPYMLVSVFRKQTDAKGWEPTPCSSVW